MGKIISRAATAIIGLIGLVTPVSAGTLTHARGCIVVPHSAKHGLTERLQLERYTIVKVTATEGRLVLRSDSGVVHELACGAGTHVTIHGTDHARLESLGSGDTVGISGPGRVSMIRAAWEEISSPEH